MFAPPGCIRGSACGKRTENLAEYAKLCIDLGIEILAVQETKRGEIKEPEEFWFEGELLKKWRFVGTSLVSDHPDEKGGVGFILGPGVTNLDVIEFRSYFFWILSCVFSPRKHTRPIS